MDPDSFSPEIINSVAEIALLLDLPALTLDPRVKDGLQKACKQVDCPDSMVNLLSQYPTHGSKIVQASQKRLREFDEVTEWHAKIKDLASKFAKFPDGTTEFADRLSSFASILKEIGQSPASSLECYRASMPSEFAETEAAVVSATRSPGN